VHVREQYKTNLNKDHSRVFDTLCYKIFIMNEKISYDEIRPKTKVVSKNKKGEAIKWFNIYKRYIKIPKW
jgi:hypothetical protein